MPKYEIVRPWFGVKAGDVVDMERVHPSLASHVKLLSGTVAEVAELLDPTAPPPPPPPVEVTRQAIMNRLRELKIQFHAKLGDDKLLALLPDDDPLKVAAE
ncbi:hypothetical protein FBF48_10275 [Streptococcus salivarius]|uniref:Uncharacterized protein n=1 Tax=Streptococcus salivarius TaxID=1304 RepID=A0AAX2V0J7_STRSL|nr:hypothetical protein [Streptococcus salivarius]TNF65774.1 hypothetical protein FBF48_10275 [Streptococcus salivarius]